MMSEAMLPRALQERLDELRLRATILDKIAEIRRRPRVEREPLEPVLAEGHVWIYFIQAGDDGAIKIGSTVTTPRRRLGTLQTSTHVELRLLAVMQAEPMVEGELHDRFAAAHLRGEWFEPTPELRAYIQGLVGE